jgi:hypothetical protein
MTAALTSGMRVRTLFGAAVVVEGMPEYPGYVYVSMPNPFSDTAKHVVLPMRREFVIEVIR